MQQVIITGNLTAITKTATFIDDNFSGATKALYPLYFEMRSSGKKNPYLKYGLDSNKKAHLKSEADTNVDSQAKNKLLDNKNTPAAAFSS